MPQSTIQPTPQPAPKVALVLHQQFRPLLYAIVQAEFSLDESEDALFALCTMSENARPMRSAGMTIAADGGWKMLETADFIVFPGWHEHEAAPDNALLDALKRAHARGATLVGLCYGAYVLAHTGLLDGRRATTHWRGAADFRRLFPQVVLDDNALYIEDGRLITSAGVVAGLDCCLAIVRKRYGVRVANRIARTLVAAPHREGGQAQFIEHPLARKSSDHTINQLLAEVHQNPQKQYLIDEVAARLAMSRSTFTRHFKKAAGMPFNQWRTEMRLQQARDLLESTTHSIEHIAEHTGYQSAAAFRAAFRKKHHISPKEWRRHFQGASVMSRF